MQSDSSRQILVVEDEIATRKLLVRQLSQADYAVTGCANGRDALQALQSLRSGIILADWSMPEMDGIELCRAVRELEQMQALGHLYFILLTAHDSKASIVQGLEAGANDYLTKPYHKGELLARIAVGERLMRLQEELLQRNIQVHKANAQLAALSNKLEELANTDALTSLANRRNILETFDKVWADCTRQDKPLSCIMLDVDHFKQVNDTYGHAAGDAVLVEVARLMKQTARRREHCGRLGGEEFVLICSNMDGPAAATLAEELRLAVAAHPIPAAGENVPVSISCGVATRCPATQTPEDLVKLADQMLYDAKGAGRNRTLRAAHNGSVTVTA